MPLDAEEQAILESVENGEWQSVPNLVQEVQRYQDYAQAQVSALETVSIELPASDLQSLKNLAQTSGTSVSKLIATVVHRFVSQHKPDDFGR
jgi:predicted DNA binding CopG/RHH family protein